jgi:hypothetical protein
VIDMAAGKPPAKGKNDTPNMFEDKEVAEKKLLADAGGEPAVPEVAVTSDNAEGPRLPDTANEDHPNTKQVVGVGSNDIVVVGPGPNLSAGDYESARLGLAEAEGDVTVPVAAESANFKTETQVRAEALKERQDADSKRKS